MSLLEAAAAYGRVLQNTKLENKSICSFIPKPFVYRMEQRGDSSGVTPQHLLRMRVSTSWKRIKMKLFLPPRFAEDGDQY